jgi:hypothetical protein
MSYSSNFTITTLSESISQREFKSGVVSSQAPFRFGGNFAAQTLRLRNSPYIASEYSDPPNTTTEFAVDSGGGGGVASYISPFFYMDYETSSSTNVVASGTLSDHTGTLAFQSTNKLIPRYSNVVPYSGSFSMQFRSSSLSSNSGYEVLNLGRPVDLAQLDFVTGSFSYATWYRPNAIPSNNYGGLLNFARFPYLGQYSWMIVLGSNSGSTASPIGWYYNGSGSAVWNWLQTLIET